jgi:O-antigen ligase
LVTNDLTVVAVLAPLAVAAALVRPHPAVRLLVALFFVALMAVIGVARSRTALITTVVSLACFAALARGRAFAWSVRGGLAVAGALAMVVAVDAALGFPFAHKMLGEWQGNGRLSLWAAALAMFRDAPVLGQGPHGFMLHHRAYLDGLSLPAWVHIEDRVTPWAHNLYLELLAEQGALGLAAFGATVVAAAVTFARIRHARQGDLQLLAAGAAAALVAFLTAAWTELSLIRAWVTIVLFTLLGLLTTLSRVERESRV